MAKTLVVCKHHPGPSENGFDNCHARFPDGFCPGIKTALWLNGLGDDDQPYTGAKNRYGHVITNGEVRDNWLRSDNHIVAKEPELAKLRAEERRLAASLRIVKREIKRIEKAA
jgi:hypothetical protein